MQVFDRLPSAELRPYIDRFWGVRAASREDISLADALPGTGAEMMFFLGDRPSLRDGSMVPRGLLLCLRGKTLQFGSVVRGLDLFCIRFRAGALRHFVAREVSSFTDFAGEFELREHSQAPALEEVLSGTIDVEARCRFAERALLGHLRRHLRPDALADRAVRAIYRSSGNLELDALAADLGVTNRHLCRVFGRAMGGAPKGFAGLVRLQKTLKMLARYPDRTVADVAAAQGYFDQAHFHHALRQITGASPRQLRDHLGTRLHLYRESIQRA